MAKRRSSGSRAKRPIFKRWWFWLLLFLVIGAVFGGKNKGTEKPVETSAAALAGERSLPAESPTVTAKPKATAKPTAKPTATPAPSPSASPAPTASPTPSPEATPTRYIHGVSADTIVYVSQNGKIHRRSNCSGMKTYTEMTLGEAAEHDYDYCSKCW